MTRGLEKLASPHGSSRCERHACGAYRLADRPTPLQHYIFPSGGEGMYLVVDENATFKSTNFTKAISSIKPKSQPKERGGKGKSGKGEGGGKGENRGGPSDCFKLIKMVVEKGLDPLIVFAFGKKMCEALARQTTTLQVVAGRGWRAQL